MTDQVLYVIAEILQLAAMVYAVRVLRTVEDRRPWLLLFASLLIMFVSRLLAFSVPGGVRQHIIPWIAVPVSTLLLASLILFRRLAIAEHESKVLADQRTSERDESERRYRALAELSPDVMFVNVGGRIDYANAAAVRFFGAGEARELLGRSPLDLVASGSRRSVEKRLRELREIGQIQPATPEDWTRLDGMPVPVEAAAAVVPWHGGKGIQVVLRDVSERKKAEEERSQLLASERAARSAAEHASRMKDEFLATLSHELRTPLNAILGWSQVLRKNPLAADETAQGLETIERNARVQTKLIEDLLDMSCIISGKLRLDIQRAFPITFIEAAIETIRPSAEAKTIRLEAILDPQAGPLLGDPQRLQQIVWNLLSNAVKFTPKGGKVQVVLARVNSHVEISVADTGQGIPAEFLPFVFDRFRQADASTTRKHGGLGIGLSIVKQLVELHGGSVRVSSGGPDQGTTFVVNLPLSAIHPKPDAFDNLHPATATDGLLKLTPVDLAGVKILVVDDEADACVLIKRILGECRAEVLSATSAAEAMPLIESVRPDVLISDIGMPEVDGYEFMRRVRALGPARGGTVPAIALTAFARSEDRTSSLLVGYSVHVAKPVEPQELIATVASLAGRIGRN